LRPGAETPSLHSPASISVLLLLDHEALMRKLLGSASMWSVSVSASLANFHLLVTGDQHRWKTPPSICWLGIG